MKRLLKMTAVCAAFVLLPATGVAAKTTSTTSLSIDPGIFYKADPCANGGAGEDVELTDGSIDIVTDRNGNLRQVTYQDVVGVGVVTGLAYTVTYTESHPTETRFTARLTMQSSESFFTELTTMSYQGIPITIDRCR